MLILMTDRESLLKPLQAIMWLINHLIEKTEPTIPYSFEKHLTKLINIYNIEFYNLIHQFYDLKKPLICLTKYFLTARLKSTLFNDNYNEVSLYA